jgi:hypothetical protein
MVGNGRASKLRVDKMEMIHIRNYIYPNEEKKREGKDENKKLVTFKLQPVIDFIGSSVLDSLFFVFFFLQNFRRVNSLKFLIYIWKERRLLSLAHAHTHTFSHAITHTVG